MRLSRTVFEILSIILQKLKTSRDSDHASVRDDLSSVGWDLLCSTHRLNLKVSTITCNEEIKGNAKCKNSRFEPPFGGIRSNAQDSSMAQWKARCPLPICDN